MDNAELVRASSVLMSSGQEHTSINEPWQALNPCPSCGSNPFDSPEGVTTAGTPRWVHEHCWKCGFRPGVNEAVDMAKLREQFDKFQQFLANEPSFQHPSLSMPSDVDNNALMDRIAALESQIAEANKVSDTANPPNLDAIAAQSNQSDAIDVAVSDATPSSGVKDSDS